MFHELEIGPVVCVIFFLFVCFWLVFSITPSSDEHSRLSSSFISSGEVVTDGDGDSL